MTIRAYFTFSISLALSHHLIRHHLSISFKYFTDSSLAARSPLSFGHAAVLVLFSLILDNGNIETESQLLTNSGQRPLK